jgi:hypothetical protein
MAMAATGAASEAEGEMVTRTHLTDRKTTLSLITYRYKPELRYQQLLKNHKK